MVAPSTHSASRDTPLRPKLPLRLGRFTLCEELGAGGMATVYLARMELAAGLDRLVALKTIHPHLARERAFVDMFLDEARIASHVSHPNVCAVHDFGEVGGVYYLAMEHLIGEPLFDVINRLVDRFDDVREVLPFIAARVIADGCEGLHAAHTARGPDGTRLHIVHRDVSPQNLFVTYDGAVKVVDFGCAKAAQRVAHTSTGVMKGKVGYAAPEQLRADEVDARADVWALGVCLWEALTLSPLFTKATAMKTAMSVLEDDVPLACDDRSWIPEQVAKIAGKALTRDRDRRYASARDMGRDLRKFIADSGYTLEAAELAEWMDFLFDDRHEERERQARRVREMDVSDVAVALPEMLGEVAAEDVVLLPDSTSAMEAIAAAERGEIARSEPPPAPPEPRDPAPEAPPPRASSPAPAPRRRASRWPVVILLLLALSAGGYVLNLYYEPAPWLLDLFRGSPGDTGGVVPDPAEVSGGEGEEATTDEGAGLGSEEGDEGAAQASADPPSADPPSADPPSADPPSADPPSVDPPAASAGAGAEPSEAPRRPRSRERGGVVTTVVSGGGGSVPVYEPTPAPTPAPPPPSSAQSSGGFVRITASRGWAEVYLGTRSLGRTPLHRELPVGRHRLRVLPYGREPAESLVVDVEPGVDQSLDIDVGDPPP